MNSRTVVLVVAACAFAVTALAGDSVTRRGLTFERRVEAQEAIERVYYQHQIDATLPFEQAVPRAILEAKVRGYLAKSAALEAYWNTPVTDRALQRELERIARGTKMPERLVELYAALGNDPFLIKECLARATLVDRLTRNFFAFDGAIHGAASERAGRLHQQLASGELSHWESQPERSERVILPGDEFSEQRAQVPAEIGKISPIEEEEKAFVMTAVLAESPRHTRVAVYAVPKIDWSAWWETAQRILEIESVETVATPGDALPAPPLVSSDATGSPCAADDRWDNGVLERVPMPRYLHTAIWTGNLVVIWGGRTFTGYGNENTGGRYDPATDSWLATSTVGAPTGRWNHTAVWTGTTMVVWGGIYINAGNHYENSGGRYDPISDSWRATSIPNAPAARSNHTAVWTGSTMIVWGGANASGALSSGGRYDPTGDSWTPTATAGAPSATTGHSAVWSGSSMLVWGGSSGAGGRYNPVNDSWTAMSTLDAPSPRVGHKTVWTGKSMLVWGGSSSGGLTNSGGRYDPVADVWSPMSITGAPSARRSGAAAWTGTAMVVWGGYGFQSPDVIQYFGDGGRYDPVIDTWLPMSSVGAPSPRSNSTAVWNGSSVIVWGGYSYDAWFDDDYVYDTGGRYNPASDTWTPTSLVGTPRPRWEHTSVWTGNLMVVWGGWRFSSAGDGGRYDPVTDDWTATSDIGAPLSREAHSAVWTGNAMIIWGGDHFESGQLNYLASGARYDPIADVWTPTSLSGAPSGRYAHAAVWSGSRMVIWGGTDGGYPTTGARYDPTSDTWTPISTSGAPAGRERMSAVWTGHHMIVWGGRAGNSSPATGGRYDPGTDAWSPTSMVNAPSGRYLNPAIWTGSRLVVWGGVSYATGTGVYIGTGGRYDPVADEWAPTSMAGAPSARGFLDGVWTGDELVFWGGSSGGPDLTTGGRYNPATDSWRPTSMVDTPGGRWGHTSVWTGTEMMIWGGYSSDVNNAVDTLGRYFVAPPTDDDADGTRNVCDNCAAEFNPAQSDTDIDGAGDACDLDDGVIYLPGPSDAQSLQWQNESGYTAWNVYEGDLDVLRSTGVYTQAPGSNPQARRTCGLTETSSTNGVAPSAGHVTFSLVTGVAAGVEGTLGADSLGTPRPNTNPCP